MADSDLTPDQQDLDEEGLGDTTPGGAGAADKWRKWLPQQPPTPPSPANFPAPPQQPKPSLWQRIGAGVLGGMAGVANASYGYPGGPRRPIDVSGATNAILGYDAYDRARAQWADTMEQQKAAQGEQERQYENQLKAMETMARLEESDEYRQQRLETYRQQQQNIFEKNNPYGQQDLPTQTLPMPAVPASVSGSPVDAPQMPEDIPQPPDVGNMQAPMPSVQQSLTSPNLNASGFNQGTPPAWLQRQPGGPPPLRFSATPQAAAQMKADATAVTVTPELIQSWAGVPGTENLQPGAKVSTPEAHLFGAMAQANQKNKATMDALQAKLDAKENAADKLNEEVDARTSVAAKLGLTGRDRQHYIATGQFQQNPPATQINMADPLMQATVENYGKQFAITGKMPPVAAMGGQALRTQVAMAATKYAQENGLDTTKQMAQYEANQKSLDQLQPRLDQITAFENTALKNLDLFASTVKGLSDTGVPILNAQTRAAENSILGNAHITAYNTARQVALTEIAKVVNSPGLSGALSDSGRKEVTSLVPDSATAAQINHAVEILKRDMENRRTEYEGQVKDIMGRITGVQEPAPAPAAAAPHQYAHNAVGPNGVKIGSDDGVNWIDKATGQPFK